MPLPSFILLRPRSIAEATELLAEAPEGSKILAGGTDLVPSLKQGLFAPARVIELGAIPELRSIEWQPDGSLLMGAMVRIAQIAAEPEIGRRFPALAQAAGAVASPVLRNMGTVGGNLCLDTRCVWYNQSYLWRQSCGFCIKKEGSVCHVAPGGSRCWAVFSADTPPALLALDATVEIAGPGGRRWLPLGELYTGAGERPLHLGSGELIVRIRVPAVPAGGTSAYRKFRVRGSIDYPLAGVAAALQIENGIIRAGRIALTAVNPAPRLVEAAGAILSGLAIDDLPQRLEAMAQAVNRTAKPLTTSALTPEYRRTIVSVLARRALLACVGC